MIIHISPSAYSQVAETEDMHFILLDNEIMQKVKARISFGSQKTIFPEVQAFLREADQKLQEGPFSVTHKTQLPPSGDKHDYTSMGPYWWPDPEKEDGLPYIRRDGEINPEYYGYKDKEELGKLMDALKTLSEAFYFSAEEAYAEHAIRLLRAWFLDSETKMNPNLNYAQRIPGRTEGRGIGIIDTRSFSELPDMLYLLSGSEHWNAAIANGMENWIALYLDWLINSDHGKDEAVHGNNHTTWYFAQTIPLALYVDQREIADSLAQAGLPLIMDEMIEADGSQPKELDRTRSWDYSAMNLLGIMTYARAASQSGMDLWNYENPKGGSIREALDFMVPFLKEKNEWPYNQIQVKRDWRLAEPLAIAAKVYQYKPYKKLSERISGEREGFLYWDLLRFREMRDYD
ncbi:alginate lyase family protein [Cyclobacterium jeungdonense]|uniref:Alginate lyase family protein n=1 Tax=Cyclobacterium jeungdonense TaxID=708087 RepID=A0ABT8C2U6_9BACT|nr:alginate lyase family protein [Cyclobacterium jeungdonense]MDN3686354.1 alginate lyase family protein [Cyclobacterium jeungdonense]